MATLVNSFFIDDKRVISYSDDDGDFYSAVFTPSIFGPASDLHYIIVHHEGGLVDLLSYQIEISTIKFASGPQLLTYSSNRGTSLPVHGEFKSDAERLDFESDLMSLEMYVALLPDPDEIVSANRIARKNINAYKL